MATYFGDVESFLKLDIKNFEDNLKKAENDMKGTVNSFSNFKEAGDALMSVGKTVADVGMTMTDKLTRPIVEFGKQVLSAGIEFESAFAGVRKTVDATEEDFGILSDSLKEMAERIPMTTTELAEIMELAGQLGIRGTENLTKFTGVIAALGVSTNLTNEEAATMLAQYSNITGMDISNIDRLASVIVELGNNFATTENDIVRMASRLAGAGSQVGMTDAQIMAFATSLTSVGIQAEMGGSAFSKLMMQMKVAAETGTQSNEVLSKTGLTLRELEMLADSDAKSFKAMANEMGYTSQEFKGMMEASRALEEFSAVTGMTAEEFKKAYGEDAAGAMISFIAGLKDIEDQGGSAIVTLDNMGITEVRLRDTILRSVGAVDVMTSAQEMANSAWEENIALQNEADQRYGTTESKIEMLKNSVNNLAIQFSDVMIPVLEFLIEKAKGVVEWLQGMSDEQRTMVVIIAAVVAAIGPLTTIIGGIITSIGAVIKVVGLLNGALMALVANPVGAVIAALAVAALAVYAAFQWFNRGLNEAREKVESFGKDVPSLNDALQSVEPNLMNVNNLLSNTGRTMSELDSAMRETEQNITNVLKAALSEQRGLRQEDLDSIRDYTNQLLELQAEKLQMYRDQQIAELKKLQLEEATLTQEAATQRLVNAEAALRQSNAMTEEAYSAQLVIIENKYKAMGEIGSEAYIAEQAQARDFYQQSLTENSSYYAQTLAAASEGAANWVDADREKWEQLASNGKMGATEYANILESIDSENTKMFLQMVATTVAAGGEISEETKNTAAMMLQAFDNLPPKMEEAGKSALQGLSEGMESVVPGLEDTAEMSSDAIVDAFRDHLKIESPSKVMQAVGENSGEGVIVGLKNKLGDIGDTSTSMGETVSSNTWAALNGAFASVGSWFNEKFTEGKTAAVSSWGNAPSLFNQTWSSIRNTGETIFNTLRTNIANTLTSLKDSSVGTMNNMGTNASTIFTTMKDRVSNIVETTRSSVTNSWTTLGSSTNSAFDNMNGGVQSRVGSIKSTIVTGFDSATDHVQDTVKDGKSWGTDLMDNIVSGIKGAIGKVKNACISVADTIKSILGFSVPEDGPLRDFETYMPDMIEGLTRTLLNASPMLLNATKSIAEGISTRWQSEQYQLAFAAATDSGSGMFGRRADSSLYDKVVNTDSSKSIIIENITVRDDRDIEMITEGLYNDQDKKLRALGRRRD